MKKSSPLYGVKPQVLSAPAYTLRALDAEIKIKLNQNENPYDFPEDLKEEIFRRFKQREWSRYPDFVPDALRQQLADFAGWKKDGMLVGNGSNELLQACLMTLVKSRTRVVIPAPTFTVYRLICKVLGAQVVDAFLNPDMTFNVDAILSKCEESGASILIINTPNNPTGSVLEEDALKTILARFSGHVLLDEAYYEFWGRTAIHLLESYPRLIITRTFSKAMGMAGLRVGYMMAHPDLATQISKAKLPYNVNQFSLTAAEVALQNIERFKPAIDAVLKERARLGQELANIPGINVYPTKANYFLVESEKSPQSVFEYLYSKGILIRDVSSYPMLSKCMRISVGKPEENDRLLLALNDFMRMGAEEA